MTYDITYSLVWIGFHFWFLILDNINGHTSYHDGKYYETCDDCLLSEDTTLLPDGKSKGRYLFLFSMFVVHLTPYLSSDATLDGIFKYYSDILLHFLSCLLLFHTPSYPSRFRLIV